MIKVQNSTKANFGLTLITLVWGVSFVLLDVCIAGGATPAFINLVRGAIYLVCITAVGFKKIFPMTKKEAVYGFGAGAANAVAYLLQAYGLQYAKPSTGAFLTTLYIVLVPLMTLILFRKKVPFKLLPAVLLSVVGAAILSGIGSESMAWGKGEWLCLSGAFAFALSIALLGHAGEEVRPLNTAWWVALTQTLFGLVLFLCTETQAVKGMNFGAVWLPLLGLGVGCSFLASTVQVLAQKYTDAGVAAVLMALEGVFGAIFSVAFGREPFVWQTAVGGALIFVGALIAVFPLREILQKRGKHTAKKCD